MCPASIFQGNYVKLLKDKLKFKEGGVIEWDHVSKCPSYPSDIAGVNNQIGQELHVRVYNPTLSVIPNGSLVYAMGVDPDGTHVAVMLAKADAYDTSRVLGMVTADIPSMQHGIVTREGLVNDLDTSLYSSGDVLKLSPTIAGAYELGPILDGNFDVTVGVVAKSHAVTGSILVLHDANEYTTETTQKTGWSNTYGPATLSFVDGTRTLTLTPVGSTFHFYQDGIKYSKATDSIQIANTEGAHYIYYNLGVLVDLVNPTMGQIQSVIANYPTVAIVYWNATGAANVYMGKELHDMQYASEIHVWAHFAFGSRYINGLGLNSILSEQTGALNSHAQFGVDSGAIADEDIYHPTNSIASTTGLPIFYLAGTSAAPTLRKLTNAGFAVSTTGTGRLAYNFLNAGNWTIAEVPNTNFVLCHVFCINENDIAKRVVAFMGQSQYATVALARAGATTEISTLVTTGLLPQESKSIATVIFQTADAYLNSVNARIRQIEAGVDYEDWRAINNTGGSVSTGPVSTIFSDANFQVFDDADPTKSFQFQASGITTGTNRVLTAPDANITLVGEANAATLTNKKLSDSTTEIVDVGDPTKVIAFDAEGTAGTKTTIKSSQTTNKILTLPDATDTLVGKATTDEFTNKSFGDAITQKQIATPSTPAATYNKRYPKSDTLEYFLTPAGKEMPIDLKGDYNFLWDKVLISDYVTYDDGATAIPVDGIGGSPTVITVAASPSPITNEAGVFNLRISKSAANGQGEGVAVTFTVRGSVDYGAIRNAIVQALTSAGYADGDAGIYLFAVDGSTTGLVYPANQDIYASSFVSNQQFSFQLNGDQFSPTTTYRLIIHCQTTNASAWDIDLVLKFVESKKVTGPIDIDWRPVTMTCGLTGATGLTVTAYEKIRGEVAYYKGKISWSTVFTGGAFTLSLPRTIKSSVENIIQNYSILPDSSLSLIDSGAASYRGAIAYNNTTSVIFKKVTVSGANTYFDPITTTAPFTWANADSIEFEFSAAMQGLSSNQVLSEDVSSRDIELYAYSHSVASYTGNNNEIKFTNVPKDNSASYSVSTGRFTAPETADYLVSYKMIFAMGATPPTSMNTYVRINGVSGDRRALVPSDTLTASKVSVFECTEIISLIKGQYISPWIDVPTQTVTVTDWTGSAPRANFFSVKRLASPQQIAASERCYGHYQGTDGTTITGAGADVQYKYVTKKADSHNLYNPANGELTIDRNGTLDLSFSGYLNIAGTPWSGSEFLQLTAFADAVAIGANYFNQTSQAGGSSSAEINITNYPVTRGMKITTKAAQTSGSSYALAAGSYYSRFSWEIK